MIMKNLGKKLVLITSIVMTVSLTLTACGKAKKEDGKLVIGINQLMEHPALDSAREGFIDGLKEMGVDAEVVYMNSQGDIPNSISISEKFASDKVDLIYAIGTPAAQSTKQVARDIPVLFSAVTDPVESGLVESWDKVGTNVTGTSDKANIEEQLKLFSQIDKDIKTIGVIYNTGESNSNIQLKELKEVAGKSNLKVEAVGISNINDVAQSLESLTKKVDALYMLSDNMVASSVGLVSQKLIEKNMISVSAEESQVLGGILITQGISYYELGKDTAKMAKEILIDKKDIKDMPVGLSQNKDIKINKSTLDQLKINKNLEIFKNAVILDK